MLIHIGNNEFIDFKNLEAIINLQTIDQDSRNRILGLIKNSNSKDFKTALLTRNGVWTGSTLSSEALAQRGVCHPFQQADYLKKEWKESSHYIY
jgi:hypothetical protein